MLRHVEIVGGGQAHNQSYYAAALQVVRRSPILENVNITNSSMGGMQVRFLKFINLIKKKAFRLFLHVPILF